MRSSLQHLLDQRQLWRARDNGDAGEQALASGWLRLDRELYGAGWPIANLSELLCAEPVLAWQLLQPALVRLSQQQRLLIWIGHRSVPYAPAWFRAGLNLGRCLLVRASEDEAPWAAEQALRLASGGAVILQSQQLTTDRLRRLQLAAQTGNSFAFLLRPLTAQRQSTPAALRMSVMPAVGGLQLRLHKRRGGTASAPFVIPMTPPAPALLARLPSISIGHHVGAAALTVPELTAPALTTPVLTTPVLTGPVLTAMPNAGVAGSASSNVVTTRVAGNAARRGHQSLNDAVEGFFNAG